MTEIYSEFLALDTLLTIIKFCKRNWSEQLEKYRPNSIIEVHIKYNYEYFPNITFLLKILVTLPISTSILEYTLYRMKRLINY